MLEQSHFCTLQQLFCNASAKSPNKIAISFGDKKMTYSQMDEASNSVAQYIHTLGIKVGGFVGIRMHRSLELIIAIYGIVKSGCAYIPIDVDAPYDKMLSIVNESDMSLLFLDDKLNLLSNECGVKNVCLASKIDEIIKTFSKHSVDFIVNGSDLAYVIYTSGSTGKPKGVMISHESIVDRLMSMQKVNSLDGSDVFLQKTPYTFDVSIYEIFLPLIIGAKLVIAKPNGHKDAKYLCDIIASEGVTVARFVPCLLDAFLDRCDDCDILMRSLKCVISSGEELSGHLRRKFFAALPNVKLFNFYGPTEASIDVCYHECSIDETGDCTPIGVAFDNTDLYILNDDLSPVQNGEVGELYAGGIGLSAGYLGMPKLTKDKFIHTIINENLKAKSIRLYATGDMAKRLENGNLIYIGRRDFQVKINGVRVELGEIESAILKCSHSVRDAIVIYKLNMFVAFLKTDKDCDLALLREKLKTKLPPSIIPHHFIQVASFPLTVSGKIDRIELIDIWVKFLNQNACDTDIYEVNLNETEKKILNILRSLLKTNRIFADDNFFDNGLDSLSCVHFAILLEKEFGVDINESSMLKNYTARKLAIYIKSYAK